MGTGAGRVFLLALVLLFALQTTPASADKKAMHDAMMLPLLSPFCLLPCVIFFSAFPASLNALLATITDDFTILPYDLRAISGVALQIDESFVPLLRQLPGVIAVIPDTLYKPHTTHSWDFLGLAGNGGEITPAWSSAKLGVGTIIGVIDTGVWPESQSFQNDTMPDVPLGRWRGTCEKGNDPTFQCNRKLIGARFFSEGIQASGALGDGGGQQQPSQADLSSPRDYVGHGTHTMSTAGGSFVRGASVFGHGKGTAAGGSPGARVAAYKACYEPGCSSIDILAAIVAAVADGVHVLSLSLGAPPGDYLTDLTAIGAFFAVQSGVTVVCSAGNSGPQPSTATNLAPWIFTVGASTMDRDFPAYVSFNGATIQGQSLADSTLPIGQPYQIISGEKANAVNQPTGNWSLCLPGSLDPDKVKGKIVVCVRGVNARVEKGNPLGYINATDESFGVKPAPKIAAFSSRGPNAITPQILKPDITAPGVNVIAAYSGAVSPTELPFDDRRVAYNIMSGTSMSCPHVSGIVGLLKTKYPSWSPAMIKSAIMTTGTDPGLVYDTTLVDYTNFLCSLKPTQTTQDPIPSLPVDLPMMGSLSPPVTSLLLPLFNAAGEPCKCSQGPYGRPEDLNYPSIAVPCLSGSGATVKRRLKNVGGAPSKYKVTVTEPAGVKVTVAPSELDFVWVGEEKEFTVKLDMDVNAPAAANDYVFGSIVWSDADGLVHVHVIRAMYGGSND
ncbi:unnamed protein product [Miscanthus lutarioriparius]|uniref:Uncharacterized protein n=1 Tax=Miscanthus lutarioriparius TaxID=422564 RepID=A0A811PCD5_9POAL|nr:unnamed protein product [Miscanthus lutarioriparius]